jgi:hypothetical protein
MQPSIQLPVPRQPFMWQLAFHSLEAHVKEKRENPQLWDEQG